MLRDPGSIRVVRFGRALGANNMTVFGPTTKSGLKLLPTTLSVADLVAPGAHGHQPPQPIRGVNDWFFNLLFIPPLETS